MRTGRALGQLPLVAKEVREEVVAPLGRRRGPGNFETAGVGIAPLSGAEAALPAEALLLDGGGLRFRADIACGARAMGLAERVPAGDERHRLLVVHRHAAERLANVQGRRGRLRR